MTRIISPSTYTQYIQKYFDKRDEREKRTIVKYLYIILTLFTVSFFSIFAIRPTLSTISTLKKQYEDNKAVYDALVTKLAALAQLDTQKTRIDTELPLLYGAIPTSGHISSLTRQIENLAQSATVAIDAFDIGNIELYPLKKKEPIFSYSFTLVVRGDEARVNQFITRLANFDRLISLDRLTTGRGESGFSASITGRAYFYTL